MANRGRAFQSPRRCGDSAISATQMSAKLRGGCSARMRARWFADITHRLAALVSALRYQTATVPRPGGWRAASVTGAGRYRSGYSSPRHRGGDVSDVAQHLPPRLFAVSDRVMAFCTAWRHQRHAITVGHDISSPLTISPSACGASTMVMVEPVSLEASRCHGTATSCRARSAPSGGSRRIHCRSHQASRSLPGMRCSRWRCCSRPAHCCRRAYSSGGSTPARCRSC